MQPYQGQQAQHVEDEPPTKPRPYRVDTSGLSTSHLPPPPMRRDADGRTPQPSPSSGYSPSPTKTAAVAAAAKPKMPPSLPPRLPPRSGNSTPSPTLPSKQGASYTQLNQGAVDRLNAAGISVPGLGIGGGWTPPPPPPPSGARSSAPSIGSSTQAPGYGQLDELQSRFARIGASSSSPTGSVSHGTTTWAQKPAGSSGSRADNTRQGTVGQAPSVLGKKKPPPPPGPKKPGLSGAKEGSDTPPPIPLATRPRFD
jgi:hypothetical protein